MKYNFAIGIPTINQAELLNKALFRYKQDFPAIKIYVVDNGKQNIIQQENLHIHRPEKNIGVAASWNYLCKKIFQDHEWALVLNDDILLGSNQTRTQSFILVNAHLGFFAGQKEWSVFGISKNTYNNVGDFDERFFPAYFEDNDYWHRMKKRGIQTSVSERWNPEVYNNSMSIKKEPDLNKFFMKNREYYIQKWGGVPGQERFKTPFDTLLI